MGNDSIINALNRSAKNFAKNPIVALPTIISLILLTFFSLLYLKLGGVILSENSVIPTIFLIVFVLINLLILAYLFSGLISMCLLISKSSQKAKIRDFFAGANKFWLKNFAIIILIYIVYDIIRLAATYGVYYLGNSLSLSTEVASFIFFFVYFAGLIGILIFMTFSNFFLILENLSVWKSIKKSANFVSNNYLQVLSISVIFFIVFRIISYIDQIYSISWLSLSELVSSIVIYPYIALVLSIYLVLNRK